MSNAKGKREISVSVERFADNPFPGLDYWLEQPAKIKAETAWQMVIEAHRLKGEDLSESRLQRAALSLERRES